MKIPYTGYAIWDHVLGSAKEIRISKGEFDDINHAQQNLRAIQNIEEKYFLVSESYKNFEKYIFEVKLDGLLYQIDEVGELHDIRVEAGRLAHSYLSSVSLYVENIQLKKVQKIEPSIQLDFSKQLKEGSLECIAITKLRNYVHHNDLATTHASFGRGRSRDLTQVTYFAEFYFETERLSVDNKTTAAQLSLIKTLGDRIELKDLFRRYFGILASKHHELRQLLHSRSNQSAILIENVRRRWLIEFPNFSADCFGVVVGKLKDDSRDDSVPLVSVSLQVSENMRALARRTASLENMGSRTIIW